ncbi:hypothetical protein [Streptomyces liliifuscus]|uniref:Integral membrane protein n=1 Tax=Streptomyces liliifuscus TaxID=2797636 RepID=A0A7T7I1G3_9ACTN|nr:hypothetical protein [Streptomyces liliifuscus]QQM39279.1 hypothetical protein JEQ17_07235 [Streptomyces liliifuscus]
MTSGIAFRLARAAVFAAVCVVTAALGHVLMSGAGLLWWAVGYAFAATTAAAWWLTGRERGLGLVTGATVVAQLGLHQLFGLAQRARSSDAFMSTTSMDAGHTHAHPMGPEPADTLLMGGDLGMFAAHLLAALVCGVWLWRGEEAAFRTARAIAYRTGRLLGTALFEPLRRALRVSAAMRPAGPARTPVFVPVRPLRGVLLEHAVARRGPPVAPAAR